jgi:hypothetical protein
MANRYVSNGALSILLAVLWLGAPPRADASAESVYVFRSVEDPRVPPDLSVCAAATFIPSAVLSATLYAVQTRSSDGMIVNDSTKRIGFGTACALITTLSVGATVPFIGSFNIGKRHLIGEGACVLVSNTVPTPGVVLAACTIPLGAAPGVLGGVATSNSVFNPFGLPGFNTGSIWTVRLFGN